MDRVLSEGSRQKDVLVLESWTAHPPQSFQRNRFPMKLPIIKSPEEALRLASQHGDSFYVFALRLQHWLSELSIRAVSDYISITDPNYRGEVRP